MNRKYRKTVVVGNWKMNKLPSEIKTFAEELRALVPRAKWCEVAVCVPAVMIPGALRAFKDSKVSVGAQDLSAAESGPYTGECSGAQLADAGAKYVIVGHSERRQNHGETNELIHAKAKAALESKLIPIVCVGESLEQREMGLTLELVTLQVKTILSGITAEQVRKLIIAYEPVWAIGTGKTATAEQAGEVCTAIRALIRGMYGARIARSVTIQYGGSMNGQNAAELLAQPDIDGGLVGGASLKPDEFAQIIMATSQSDQIESTHSI